MFLILMHTIKGENVQTLNDQLFCKSMEHEQIQQTQCSMIGMNTKRGEVTYSKPVNIAEEILDVKTFQNKGNTD